MVLKYSVDNTSEYDYHSLQLSNYAYIQLILYPISRWEKVEKVFWYGNSTLVFNAIWFYLIICW